MLCFGSQLPNQAPWSYIQTVRCHGHTGLREWPSHTSLPRLPIHSQERVSLHWEPLHQLPWQRFFANKMQVLSQRMLNGFQVRMRDRNDMQVWLCLLPVHPCGPCFPPESVPILQMTHQRDLLLVWNKSEEMRFMFEKKVNETRKRINGCTRQDKKRWGWRRIKK